MWVYSLVDVVFLAKIVFQAECDTAATLLNRGDHTHGASVVKRALILANNGPRNKIVLLVICTTKLHRS